MENTFRGVTVRFANNQGDTTCVEVQADGSVWFDSMPTAEGWACWFLPDEVALISRIAQIVKNNGEGW